MYLLLFLGILLIITLFVDYLMKHKYSNILLIVWITILFLVSAFRFQVGNDYINYAWMGRSINRCDNLTQLLNYINSINIEFGSIVVGYFFNMLFDNYQSYFIGMSLIQFVLLIKCIRIYLEKKYYISALTVFYLGFYLQSLNISRQFVAILICIYSYKYVINNDLKKFIITVFIAMLFHRSAIVFFVAYYINKFKIDKRRIIIIIVCIVAISLVFQDLLSFMTHLLGMYETYQFETREGIINGVISSFVFFIPSLYIYIIHKKQFEKKDEMIYKIYFIGIVLYIFSIQFFYFSRISLYFQIFFIFSLPITLKYSSIKTNKQIFLICYLPLMLLLFFRSSSDLFFSNDYIYKFNPKVENYHIEWRDNFYEIQ